MAIKIDKAALDQACKEIIESILFCIPKAYKGTVYRIGKPPGLIATRITSGIIDEKREAISWGLPEKSDYNPPGKPWMEYRDEPDRPSEAMAWCVERQKTGREILKMTAGASDSRWRANGKISTIWNLS